MPCRLRPSGSGWTLNGQVGSRLTTTSGRRGFSCSLRTSKHILEWKAHPRPGARGWRRPRRYRGQWLATGRRWNGWSCRSGRRGLWCTSGTRRNSHLKQTKIRFKIPSIQILFKTLYCTQSTAVNPHPKVVQISKRPRHSHNKCILGSFLKQLPLGVIQGPKNAFLNHDFDIKWAVSKQSYLTSVSSSVPLMMKFTWAVVAWLSLGPVSTMISYMYLSLGWLSRRKGTGI